MAKLMTLEEMHAALSRSLGSRRDLGLWKAAVDRVLESPNPFEPNALRKPQRWFTLLGIITLLVVGVFVYFNLWN